MILLLDMDHTISDAAWRDSMAGAVPWDEYHENAKDDKPIEEICTLLRALRAARGYTNIVVTGRPEKWRQMTMSWLIKHEVPIDEIRMRPNGNKQMVAELKKSLIEDIPIEDIQLAIDDNEKVVDAYLGLGIPTLHFRGRIIRTYPEAVLR